MERDRFSRLVRNGVLAIGIASCAPHQELHKETSQEAASQNCAELTDEKGNKLPSNVIEVNGKDIVINVKINDLDCPNPDRSTSFIFNPPHIFPNVSSSIKWPHAPNIYEECLFPLVSEDGKLTSKRGVGVAVIQSNETYYNDGTCYDDPRFVDDQ